MSGGWHSVDIRSLGWRRGLDVSFPKANYTVRTWSSNKLSNMWENTCCWCLCHVTIIPCIAMRCYRDCGGHKEQGVRSVFRIDYHPLQVCHSCVSHEIELCSCPSQRIDLDCLRDGTFQVFEMIRPRLWCKGWSGMSMVCELYRDLFW